MRETSLAHPPTVCILSPPGRGAVAVVAVDGPESTELVAPWFHSASGWRLSNVPVGRVAFGRWGSNEGEEVVVTRFGESVEVHCHGGAAAARAIVHSLVGSGGVEISRTDWPSHQADGEIESQALQQLQQVRTERAALVLLDQFQGALHQSIRSVVQRVERRELILAAEEIRTLLERWPTGHRLIAPVRVVLTGPPNVGKSSLINALVGYERAIVFDTPGTTRDAVTATTAIDGWAVELVDMAGLRSGAEGIELAGIELARQQLAEADLVLLVGEAASWLSGDEPCGEFADWYSNQRLLQVANKSDCLREDEVERLLDNGPPLILTSATEPHGADSLLAAIRQQLSLPTYPAGTAVPFTQWQVDVLRQALELIEQNNPIAASMRLGELIGSAS